MFSWTLEDMGEDGSNIDREEVIQEDAGAYMWSG
jgi:hypothetical protein